MRFYEFCPDCYGIIVHDMIPISRTADMETGSKLPKHNETTTGFMDFIDEYIMQGGDTECNHEDSYDVDSDFIDIIHDLHVKGYKTVRGSCMGHPHTLTGTNTDTDFAMVDVDSPYIIISAENIPSSVILKIMEICNNARIDSPDGCIGICCEHINPDNDINDVRCNSISIYPDDGIYDRRMNNKLSTIDLIAYRVAMIKVLEQFPKLN